MGLTAWLRNSICKHDRKSLLHKLPQSTDTYQEMTMTKELCLSLC